jgi:hypothetical protein
MPRTDPVGGRDQVIQDIENLVADSAGEVGCLAAARSAEALARAHPDCGMSLDEISEEIVLASIRARVPVEIDRPREGQ